MVRVYDLIHPRYLLVYGEFCQRSKRRIYYVSNDLKSLPQPPNSEMVHKNYKSFRNSHHTGEINVWLLYKETYWLLDFNSFEQFLRVVRESFLFFLPFTMDPFVRSDKVNKHRIRRHSILSVKQSRLVWPRRRSRCRTDRLR